MQRQLLFLLSFIVVAATAAIVYSSKDDHDFNYKPGISRELDTAINQARYIYQLRKSQGANFETGPCLSNALVPDWVLDIAHDPRQPIDDLPENQCSAYLEGKAHHFVELDSQGNLIRAR